MILTKVIHASDPTNLGKAVTIHLKHGPEGEDEETVATPKTPGVPLPNSASTLSGLRTPPNTPATPNVSMSLNHSDIGETPPEEGILAASADSSAKAGKRQQNKGRK